MHNSRLGVAVDVGTTTVALYLTDINTGDRLIAKSELNAQSPHGADVTARISYCAEFGHELLTRLIREQISSMILSACAETGVSHENIGYISIAANTIMQHLAAGYCPVSMGTAPFTTTSLFGMELPAWKDLTAAENAKIYYAPAISAYVGGDVTAGLLAAGFEEISEPAIYLDIGTNGEIVLKHKGVYYCCATAAGPAFEGAEITMGMVAAKGAIDHVKMSRGLEFTVIGGGEPIGICGSGLLDTLAVLLETGAVDETGRLVGKNKYLLTQEGNGIYITAEDIRKLQLAKAAIAAGIQVLLHYAGISEAGVKSLSLAGGFGSYMDLNSAARIGLFPKILLPKANAAGNTAGEGAAITLYSKEAHKQLESIRNNCEYIDLSANAFFNEKFVEQMGFRG
jgi:uncharacterized 2Fe-2S/4Fe-4S cluster protein (DUF4445 family)